MLNSKKIIFLMGPTAIGKSALAIHLKKYIPIEIINVDSALIYKDMNIGTAKPSLKELSFVKHHLLDIVTPSEYYSVANFQKDSLSCIKKILNNKNIPVLVGGTMLYYKVLLDGLSPLPPANLKIRSFIKNIVKIKNCNFLHQKLSQIDPESSKKIHPNDVRRVSRALEIFFLSGKTLTELKKISKNKFPYSVYQFALIPENKSILYNKITLRLKYMISLGFEEEVKNIFFKYKLSNNLPSTQCIGYREMWEYINGKIKYHQMFEKILISTKKLVKKQMTWLKNWKNINFIDSNCIESSCNFILKKINY